MTCIAGVVHEGRAKIAGDRWCGEWSGYRLASPKIWRSPWFVVGLTGYPRMQQVLQYHGSDIPAPLSSCPQAYLVSEFVPHLRELLKRHGVAEVKDSKESADSTMLIGMKGRLFEVNSNFQVIEAALPFNAVGCGSDFAKGALSVVDIAAIGPEAALRMALTAAEQFSAGVRGPFDFLSEAQ